MAVLSKEMRSWTSSEAAQCFLEERWGKERFEVAANVTRMFLIFWIDGPARLAHERALRAELDAALDQVEEQSRRAYACYQQLRALVPPDSTPHGVEANGRSTRAVGSRASCTELQSRFDWMLTDVGVLRRELAPGENEARAESTRAVEHERCPSPLHGAPPPEALEELRRHFLARWLPEWAEGELLDGKPLEVSPADAARMAIALRLEEPLRLEPGNFELNTRLTNSRLKAWRGRLKREAVSRRSALERFHERCPCPEGSEVLRRQVVEYCNHEPTEERLPYLVSAQGEPLLKGWFEL